MAEAPTTASGVIIDTESSAVKDHPPMDTKAEIKPTSKDKQQQLTEEATTESIGSAKKDEDKTKEASQVGNGQQQQPVGGKSPDGATTEASAKIAEAPAALEGKRDSSSSSSSDDDARIAEERRAKFATGKDYFCWVCHRADVNISCVQCPRSYHLKCVPTEMPVGKGKKPAATISNPDNWKCTECKLIQEGEERRTSPDSMLATVTDDNFVVLLRFALQTIKETSQPSFHQPVSAQDVPEYPDFILHPMDFLTMEHKVRKNEYKSTDAFLADIKWIVHNCYIFNDTHHVLTKNARYFFQVAKNEASEIEVCPDCFMNYYVYPNSRFLETCSRPHTLVYAKLKGHPFWPAKVVRVNRDKKEADCRFFGAHDRAWVSFESIFLLSESYPWQKANKPKFDSALEEVKIHVEKLDEKFPGLFKYASVKTPFNPFKPFLNSEGITQGGSPTMTTASKEQPPQSEETASDGDNNSNISISSKQKNNSKTGITKTNQSIRKKGQPEPPTPASPPPSKQRPKKRSSDLTEGVTAPSPSPLKRSKVSVNEPSKAIDHVSDEDDDDEDERPLVIDAPLVPSEGLSSKRKSSSPAVTPTKKTAATTPPEVSRRPARGGQQGNSTVGTSGASKPLPVKQPIQANVVDQLKKGRSVLPPPIQEALSAGGKQKSLSRSNKRSPSKEGNHPDEGNNDIPTGTNRTSSPTRKAAVGAPPALLSSSSATTTTSSTTSGRVRGSPSSFQEKIPAKKTMANSTPPNGSGSLLSPTKGGGGSSLIAKNNNKKGQQSTGTPATSGGSRTAGVLLSAGDTEGTLVPGNSSSSSSSSLIRQKDASPSLLEEVKALRVENKDLKNQIGVLTKAATDRMKELATLERSLKEQEGTFERRLEETKRRQWCSACLKEAIYFCCWNTSYCSYDCQSRHWPHHMSSCQQQANRQRTSTPSSTDNMKASSFGNQQQNVVNSNQAGDKK